MRGKCGSIPGVRARVSWLAIAALAVACEGDLDEGQFARRAERAYLEVHPGWTMVKRYGDQTVFVRGDQQDVLRIGSLYRAYRASGRSGSAFFEGWMDEQRALVRARRRALADAGADVIPILKGSAWVRAQDLGAVGSAEVRDRIRPWRRSIAPGVHVILGVPEERLGYRSASIEEVQTSTHSADEWLERAVQNLAAKVADIGGRSLFAGDDEARLLVLDLDPIDGVSALVLDPAFRRRMIERFGRPVLGAAVPVRDRLTIFDPSEPANVKPIRVRAHQLYDTRNHPGLRDLLRLTADGVDVWTPTRAASARSQ